MSALTNQPTCAHDGCQALAFVFVAFPVLTMDEPDLGEWFCDEHVPPIREGGGHG